MSGEVWVYWTRPSEALASAAARARCLALLDDGERERRARFVFERDRELFLAAHALARVALSRHAPVAPQAWRFRLGAHGRPEPEGGEGAAGVRFNLSHTEGLVACVVNRARDAGVDVERAGRLRDPEGLARRVLAASERATLRGRTLAEQQARFVRFWTLKEAYVKARGLGLGLGLAQIAFDVPDAHDEGAGVRVRFAPGFDDDAPEGWRFGLWAHGAEHMMAAAVRVGAGEQVRWVRERLDP